MQSEQRIANELLARGLTLAVAESCSGGLLAHRLTNIPGSSGFLMVAVVSYSNESKRKILKVPLQLLKHHGAVSREVCLAMASGVRKLLDTDYGIGITGIAGPGGGSVRKPVGLTFIAVATRQKVICQEHRFQGTRLRIKTQAANAALALLAECL